MNKVILIGRLTKDPEVRYSQSGDPVAIARYTLAVNRRFKKEGEQDVDFIPCVAFGKAGEFAERFLKKGMQILVSGRLQIRNWDDPNGQRHWQTDVILEDQEFTESKAAFEARMQQSGSSVPQAPHEMESARRSPPPAPAVKEPNLLPEGFSAIMESIDDEDLPF